VILLLCLRHPHSIDTICALPSSLRGVDTTSTVLTGSSDGFVRAVQILPTKLLGVVADHSDWHVERIAIGCGASQSTLDEQDPKSADRHVGNPRDDDDKERVEIERQRRGRWWVGSVGYDEVLKMTDLEAFFHEARIGDSGDAECVGRRREESVDRDEEEGSGIVARDDVPCVEALTAGAGEESDPDSSAEEPEPEPKKRKRKPEKNPLAIKKKKGRNTVDVEPTFFDEL
jgi:hypothetical protein